MKDFIDQNKKVLGFTLLALLIVCTLILGYFDQFIKTGAAPNGIVSFELAQTLPKTQAILSSWNEQSKIFAGLSLGFDFLYILVYTVFFAFLLFLGLQKLSKNKLLYQIGLGLLFLVFIAGSADIIENIALIKLLTGQHQPVLSQIAYWAATIKFSIISTIALFLLLMWINIFSIIKK